MQMKKPRKATTKSRHVTVRGPRPLAPRWADPLTPPQRMARNQEAAALLREWMADESGYDEEVWPALEQALKEDPIRHLGRFVPVVDWLTIQFEAQ